MKTLCTLFFLALLPLTVSAKGGSAYCLSYADYRQNAWQPIEQLDMHYRSGMTSLWWGGASFMPKTNNSKTAKILEKKARFIVHHDSLYINCRHLSYERIRLGNWYAPAFVFDRHYFVLIALNYEALRHSSQTAYMFGIIGAAIAAASSKDDYICYFYNPLSETIEPIDQLFMEKLFIDAPELEAEYNAIPLESTNKPETIIPLLQRLGLIERGE